MTKECPVSEKKITRRADVRKMTYSGRVEVSFVGAVGKAQWGKKGNMLDWST